MTKSTEINLDENLIKDLEDLEKIMKTIPDVLIRVCLRIGMNEVKEAFNLLPEKFKFQLLNELRNVLPQKT